MANQMNAAQGQQMMEQGQMERSWENGEMWGQEPRWDETRYTMPQDMGPGMGQNQWMPGQQPSWNSGMPVPGTGGNAYGMGPSSAFEQSQRMKNPVDMETTHNPGNNADAYQASLRSLLARNVGFFIVATFLTGTQRMVTWQGILHTVGSDYIVIYQPDYERYISCDFYAIKFVQFHNTRNTPYCASSHTWMAQDT